MQGKGTMKDYRVSLVVSVVLKLKKKKIIVLEVQYAGKWSRTWR